VLFKRMMFYRLQRQGTDGGCYDAMLLVYSVDSDDSFDKMLRTVDALVVTRGYRRTCELRRLPVILVANKIDLVRRRIISFEGPESSTISRCSPQN